MAQNDGRAVGTWGTAGVLVEPCDEVDKTQISLEFPISQIGNRIRGNVQCDSVTEYEQPPLASAPEACKSASPL